MTLEDFPEYEFYENGSIFSYKRNIFLQPFKNEKGYLQVGLMGADGKQHTKKVHRLIAEAFLPNPNNYEEVNHKDENKENNSVSNLEWCDHKYNCNYGTKTKRQKEKVSKKVVMCDKQTHKPIKTFNSISDACRYLEKNPRNAATSISKVCNQTMTSKGVIPKSAYGYWWEYSAD